MQDIAVKNLHEEILGQWAEQVKRSAIPVVISMSLLAYMGAQYVSVWFWGTWLFSVAAIQGLRWYVFRLLPEQDHIPVETRVQTAVAINLVGNLLHSVSLFWFPLFSPYQAAVQSTLFIGMGVGSVMMSAGFAPFARAHAAVALAPLFCLWIWSGLFGPGGNTALFLGVIGFGYVATLLSVADYVFLMYQDSFTIREKLEVALEQAESAGRAKTRFLASASHDLRQPMHALSLFSAALATRKLEDDARQIVENINASVEALSYELDGLLDISKLDAGIVSVSRNHFCLAALLRRMLQEFLVLAEKRGIRMTVDCPDRAVANTDAVLLERIVRNLITNVIAHNTQCDLTLGLGRAGDCWHLTVSDTGSGIDPSQHENIFEEFYQLENQERDRSKGLGLGLSIVRRLSDLLEIGMEFESTLGSGTQFGFRIVAFDQLPSAEIADDAVFQSDGLLESLVILVVDDEASVRAGMTAILGSLGCKVVTADSSDTAVTVAAAERPDIALVDLRLRGDDSGLIAIERLRGLYRHLPAIIISGDTAPDRLLAIDQANIPVLVKPVLIGPLKDAIIENCFPPD